VDVERAVLVNLRDPAQLGEVVPRSELQLVVALLAGDEPGVVVFDLPVGIPRALVFGTGLRQQAQVAELWRTERLIALVLCSEHEAFPAALGALGAAARVAVPPVLPRPRDPDGVHFRVAKDARSEERRV